MLSELDKKIIKTISQDIPLVEKPFEAVAEGLGIEEKVLFGRMRKYKEEGILRKFAGVINHRKVGFKNNAMVVWDIPDGTIKEAVCVMCSYPEITHCYQRKRYPEWDFNLYTMIHGKTRKDCLKIVDEISKRTNCPDHKVLFSSKEYKKTGVQY